jgi:uncharacterized membrane protein YraQ (UPF0718 family)
MRRVRTWLGLAGLAGLVVVAWLSLSALGQPGGPLAGPTDMSATFATIFLGIFIEAAPFLLLGTLASGLVEVYLRPDQMHRLAPRGALSGAVAGALLGLAFPVCECGVVPLSRRLFRKGLPLPVGVSFLLAAPVMNPIVIASTAAAFGFGRVLWLRLGLTFLIATATGLVFALARQPRQWLRPAAWPPMAGSSEASLETEAIAAQPAAGWRAGLTRALTIAVDEFFEMGRYLVAGALLASLMQTVVPQSSLLALGSGPLLSVVTLIALAVVLSICSTVDAFIALSFAGTFTTGAVMAFLVFGPMVDIKSTLMFLGVFRRRTVAYLVALPLMMTIVLAVAINLFTGW